MISDTEKYNGSAQRAAGKSDVLIVDDTFVDLNALSIILDREGYRVHCASDGRTALTLANAIIPDLILLDVEMPEMNGYAVYEQLRAGNQTQHIPVVFLNPIDGSGDRALNCAIDGADYLTKPFQTKDVLVRVHTNLMLRRLKKQLEDQNQQLQLEIMERRRAEANLQAANADLEQQVTERTEALIRVNAELKAEITQHKLTETALEERVQFETFLANLSTTFVSMPVEDIDILIKKGLQRATHFMKLDRSILVEFSEGKRQVHIANAWPPRDAEPSPDQDDEIAAFVQCAEQLYVESHIRVSKISDIGPYTTIAETEQLTHTTLKSGIAIPLTIGDVVLGTLGLTIPDDSETRRIELTPRLNIIGEVFANALMRKRVEIQIQAYTQRLKSLVADKVRELELTRAKVIQTAKLASLGEMATGVAHELNQPLTAMLFEAEYLKSIAQQALNADENACCVDAGELYRIAENLSHDIARLRRITNYLRAFNNIVKGDVIKTDINHAIKNSFTLVEARLRQQATTLRLNLSPTLPPIQANPHKLEQIFSNLISNAEYALEEMGRRVTAGEVNTPHYEKVLEVSTYVEGDMVIAQVRDNGCGMSSATQRHIFEPFFTTKPIGAGSGLGLPTCLGFVNDFGGEITFKSEENHGTTFILRFPKAVGAKSG